MRRLLLVIAVGVALSNVAVTARAQAFVGGPYTGSYRVTDYFVAPDSMARVMALPVMASREHSPHFRLFPVPRTARIIQPTGSFPAAMASASGVPASSPLAMFTEHPPRGTRTARFRSSLAPG